MPNYCCDLFCCLSPVGGCRGVGGAATQLTDLPRIKASQPALSRKSQPLHCSFELDANNESATKNIGNFGYTDKFK